MQRLGNIALLLGLLLGVVWAGRQASGAVNAEWAARNDALLRRVMNVPSAVGLEFKQTRSAREPGYTLAVFEVTQSHRRQEFALPVSQDGQRLRYDGRMYALADPFGPLRAQISLDNVPSRGAAEAPLTIVEFSDFTCIYCRRFFEDYERPLLDLYGSRVRFVYKQLPLGPARPGSEEAAVASACAFRQGNEQFWSYHDKLFAAADRLGEGASLLLELAREAGVATAGFQKCLEERQGQADVARDSQEAERLGLDATPTFFLNGRPVPGLVPRDYFFEIIEEELTAARAR